nr:hypothetical protein [Pandoravirus massiliensis]
MHCAFWNRAGVLLCTRARLYVVCVLVDFPCWCKLSPSAWATCSGHTGQAQASPRHLWHAGANHRKNDEKKNERKNGSGQCFGARPCAQAHEKKEGPPQTGEKSPQHAAA